MRVWWHEMGMMAGHEGITESKSKSIDGRAEGALAA